MSNNCKSTAAAVTRDANNNTLYGGSIPSCGGRGINPPSVASSNKYQQATAKVMFGSVTAINDLKLQDKAEREARRTH